ncbi:MAG: response regulator [Bdellovibrionales bacterium]
MARILVIDDDQTVLDLEKLILSQAGYEVLTEDNALRALDLLQLYDIDLIIVDVHMPRFDGFQFVNTVRNNSELQQTAIAFLTASQQPDAVMRAAQLGADFYLSKTHREKNFSSAHRLVFRNTSTKNLLKGRISRSSKNRY